MKKRKRKLNWLKKKRKVPINVWQHLSLLKGKRFDDPSQKWPIHIPSSTSSMSQVPPSIPPTIYKPMINNMSSWISFVMLPVACRVSEKLRGWESSHQVRLFGKRVNWPLVVEWPTPGPCVGATGTLMTLLGTSPFNNYYCCFCLVMINKAINNTMWLSQQSKHQVRFAGDSLSAPIPHV